MGRYLWLAGGLVFLGVLAFTVWQRPGDRGAETEAPSAATAAPDAERAKPDTQGLQPEPASTPVQNPASAAPQLSESSAASNDADPGEPGDLDVRWQVAVDLPQQVREQLESSDDARSREMLRRNARLRQPPADATWGPDMQERLNEFFEAPPESENMLITVACRDMQCQVQMVSVVNPPSGSTTPSQALFDELRQNWWFRDQLTPAQSLVTTVDGRFYHLQYFDRKR